MLRLRYLSSQVTVSQRPWPPPGHFATSNSASWLLDCEAWRKPFFQNYSLSFLSHLLNFLLPTAPPGAIIQLLIGEELWTPTLLPLLFRFSNLNISFSLASVHFCAGETLGETQLNLLFRFFFLRNKDKNSTRRHCSAQLRPPCTLLTHLDVSLTNDCD